MVWSTLLLCISVSTLIGFTGGRLFAGFWPRLAFFVLAAVLGMLMFPFIAGMWSALHPEQDRMIYFAFRDEAWTMIGTVIAMAAFGVWRLPALIDAVSRDRSSAP
jgi:hypothetical protein